MEDLAATEYNSTHRRTGEWQPLPGLMQELSSQNRSRIDTTNESTRGYTVMIPVSQESNDFLSIALSAHNRDIINRADAIFACIFSTDKDVDAMLAQFETDPIVREGMVNLILMRAVKVILATPTDMLRAEEPLNGVDIIYGAMKSLLPTQRGLRKPVLDEAWEATLKQYVRGYDRALQRLQDEQRSALKHYREHLASICRSRLNADEDTVQEVILEACSIHRLYAELYLNGTLIVEEYIRECWRIVQKRQAKQKQNDRKTSSLDVPISDEVGSDTFGDVQQDLRAEEEIDEAAEAALILKSAYRILSREEFFIIVLHYKWEWPLKSVANYFRRKTEKYDKAYARVRQWHARAIAKLKEHHNKENEASDPEHTVADPKEVRDNEETTY